MSALRGRLTAWTQPGLPSFRNTFFPEGWLTHPTCFPSASEALRGLPHRLPLAPTLAAEPLNGGGAPDSDPPLFPTETSCLNDLTGSHDCKGQYVWTVPAFEPQSWAFL